jgi:succinate-acetate transporter protein
MTIPMSSTRTDSATDLLDPAGVAQTHRGDVSLAHIPPAHIHAAAPAAPTEVSVVGVTAAANAVPTSVFGFAVVVTMLSLANSGLLGSGKLVVPLFMIIGFFGIGGLFELRNGDIFGGTFGVVYATFLLATAVALRFFAPAADASPAVVKAFGGEVGSLFLLFALISFIFTAAARIVNRTAVAAFALLAVVLLLAGLANIIGGSTGADLTKAAGYVGLLDGAAAFWLATGILMNVMHGKDIIPLGAAKA